VREAPAALLTCLPFGHVEARLWERARPGRRLVVVVVGPVTEPFPGGLPASVIGRTVPAEDDPLPAALATAENALTTLLASPARAHEIYTSAGRSVLLVGAGIVNLVTAWRLVREGFEVSVIDAGPDPRVGADWTEYGCTRGGGDARMATLTEADGYFSGADPAGANRFLTPVRLGGWRVAGPGPLTSDEHGWVSANAAVPPWLAGQYTRDILGINRRSMQLWDELARTEPGLFTDAGRRDRILRLYTDSSLLARQLVRQADVGADPQLLSPAQIGDRHPALAAVATSGVVAGGIVVDGFTVQVHRLVAQLVGELERSGAQFDWGRAGALVQDATGAVTGVRVGAKTVTADHLVLSPGAYGGDLLTGMASGGALHGVLGAWLSLPNPHGLELSLKIARTGHLAEDSNVTVTTGPDGRSQLVIGSGYGWTGADPANIDPGQLEVLHRAVADTARTFFPDAYEEAHDSGQLNCGQRHCVRPWTASSLGLLETATMPGGGTLVQRRVNPAGV